jgi:two-component system cell cycle response regulator DivK
MERFEMDAVKVVVIEDNPLNMELVTDLLETAGHRVLWAAKAEDGLALARSEAPDVILMDIALGGMDGLSATRLLKEDPQTCDIPVVAMTAHALRGDEDRAIQAGCTGYIVKPINTRTFVDTVTSFVRGGQ